MKKRFGNNPGKLSQASHNRSRSSITDGASDLLKAKRVRFLEDETEANHPPCHTFDACSTQCEVPEAPQSSTDPKTSEYTFFKKLKEGVGRTTRPNPADEEGIPTRSFKSSNNVGESGSAIYKDLRSSIYVKKSSNGDDISSFRSPKDTALKNSDMTGKVHKDHEWFNSSVLIKTPTAIDLDSFLSINNDASAKPETHCKDQDIFSFKRLNLKEQIVKTLFPEVDEPPRGVRCDLVSLLLRRLLPENSEITQSESPNLRQEVEENFQLCCLPDSNIQFEENWGPSRKLLKTEDGYFLCHGDSAAWSHKLRKTLPSFQTVEDIDRSAVTHADRMLLGYIRNNEGSYLNDIDNESSWSNGLGDGNLLLWRNEGNDYSTESRPNTFQERNMLKWRDDDYEYSTPCHTDTNIIKHDVHGQFSQNVLGSPHSYKLRHKAHSYGNSDGHYGSTITSIVAQGSALKYRDDRAEYDVANSPMSCSDQWCDSAIHGSFERRGISESSDLKDYDEPNHSNDIEFPREPCPLLISWGTREFDMRDSSHANMELDLYVPSSTDSEDHLLGLESGTSMGIHSSSFSCSYKFQDHIFQKCAPLPSSYVPEQLNLLNGGFLKNVFRDSHLFLLPQNHLPSTENLVFDSNRSSMEPLLLPQSSDSDAELNFNLLTGFSKKQHDISTDNVFQLLRQENPSSKLLIENESTLQLEDWSLIPAYREVSFPPRLREVRWMDTEDETYRDDSGTMDN